ncbi:MAG: hypothetical protein ABI629_22155 [bacterium]
MRGADASPRRANYRRLAQRRCGEAVAVAEMRNRGSLAVARRTSTAGMSVSICVIALMLSSTTARGVEPNDAASLARQAIAICKEADLVPPAQRAALLEAGLARAEDAVRSDPQDAAAHFAIFCNLGKHLKGRGGWGLLGGLNELSRARKELDAALALAPDYPTALGAKGQMLTELPRLLGGDRDEGERLMRRAVAVDAENPRLRLLLASFLETSGRRDEARTQASVAVGILERTGPPNELANARTLVAGLQERMNTKATKD